MTTYLSVTPGIDMSQALGGKRLTKKWLREYLRDNPQKDFRNHTGPGAYVNGEDCLNYDLSLVVHDTTTMSVVAAVEFQRVERPTESEADLTPAERWGYQAVVR